MKLLERRHASMMLVLCLIAAPAAAQQAPAKPVDPQLSTLSQGWAALAAGDVAKARVAAQRAIKTQPRSVSALTLAVEVEIVAFGPVAGLNAYEQWMQSKKVEEPYVLRRVATAFLQAASQPGGPGDLRVEALKALKRDGDAAAAATLAAAVPTTGTTDTRLMASLGDERAVKALITELPTAPSRATAIKALGDSGSRLAVPALLGMLTGGRDDDRAAAAEALGRLGAMEAVDQLKPLLNESNFTVRMTAAAALYRLDDNSGLSVLNTLLVSEHEAIRLGAAEALSVRPGGDWLDAARALTSATDPAVQLGAARLVAPHDPALAESVLSRLGQSENLAIREEAGRAFAERVVSDFATLRRLLRSPDGLTNVRAAIRILDLVR